MRDMEGKRPWWGGWASNPVGGAMRRRVGSTPAPLRHDMASCYCAATSRSCDAHRTDVRLRFSNRPEAARYAICHIVPPSGRRLASYARRPLGDIGCLLGGRF